jgi:hypothetical protein
MLESGPPFFWRKSVTRRSFRPLLLGVLLTAAAFAPVSIAHVRGEAGLPPQAPQSGVVAIRNATLVTASRGTINNGTIVMRDGKIAAIGGSGTAIPAVSQEGWATAPAAVSAISGVSTTLNSTSTASQNVVRTEANAFEQDSGKYKFEPDFPPIVDYLQRYSVRVTSTGGIGPMVATLTFRETGRVPT